LVVEGNKRFAGWNSFFRFSDSLAPLRQTSQALLIMYETEMLQRAKLREEGTMEKEAVDSVIFADTADNANIELTDMITSSSPRV
jgi:hypothetical protein